MAPLLDRFFGGNNCLLLAYGMINSGKTYTIQGTPSNPGLLPSLVEDILENARKLESKGTIREWDLKVSMLEIYQEKIHDLLNDKKEKLSIRDVNGTVYVGRLSSHALASRSDAVQLMELAASRR